MNKEVWHFENWKTLNQKLYGETLNHNNFLDDGRIHHKDSFFKIKGGRSAVWSPVNSQDNYFTKMVNQNEFYILPKRFLTNLPIKVKSYEEVRLKLSESQVWKFITAVDSIGIPKQQFWSFRDTILNFNPIECSNPRAAVLLKLIAFVNGVKIGVCGPVGSCKNANMVLMKQIRNNVASKLKNTTRAVFWVYLYHNEIINLDEFTTWDPAYIKDIEDIAAGCADDDPDMSKFSKDKNRNMMELKNINQKSVIFTFNPPSDYHPHRFRDKFSNYDKIKDRYPILYIDNKVTDSIKKPTTPESESMVKENFKEMCQIISNDAFWKANYTLHMHRYSKGTLNMKGRHLGNISALTDALDAFCQSQVEFDEWLEYLNQCIIDYNNIDNGISVSPITITQQTIGGM